MTKSKLEVFSDGVIGIIIIGLIDNLGKYADIPIILSTGSGSVSIPIWSNYTDDNFL
jgi:hypothetical protein